MEIIEKIEGNVSFVSYKIDNKYKAEFLSSIQEMNKTMEVVNYEE